MQDFDDGSYDRIDAGVGMLGNFYLQVVNNMEGCNNVSADDITKLRNISDAFLKPVRLTLGVKVIQINGANIYNDI